MPDMQLILFDDRIARKWAPFALTRPIGELLFGTLTLRRRLEETFGTPCVAHLSSEHLAGFEEAGAPRVRAIDELRDDTNRIFVLSRFVPDDDAEIDFTARAAGAVVTRSGEVVGWHAPTGEPPPPPAFLLEPDDFATDPVAVVSGRRIERIWTLIAENPDQIGRDVCRWAPSRPASALPTGAHHWGGHRLHVDPSARVEPGAALDTSDGPIWIDAGARIQAFTRLVGPAYVGPESVVLGGAVQAVSVGPVCRVRGELAETICLGYVNKQHDGHIGHAYLGRWVNLGAETTNSDLRNDYGTIEVWTPDGVEDSGTIKLGSLIGDHVKTGIGLLLNTGTVIGAGCNLFGAAMPPTYVPPFSWGTGGELTEYRLDKFLEVAERAMARRDVSLSPAMREVLRAAWNVGRGGPGA